MSVKTIGSIEMTLDPGSIQKAITEVRHIQEQLVLAMNELIEKLALEGAQIARAEVVAMDAVDTGELERSIYGYFDSGSRIGYVIAGAPHAFYVEYGTGIYGDHPEAKAVGWSYDPKGHGEGGWFYLSDRDGKVHWTRGMVSRPFMYSTLAWLEEAAQSLGMSILS